MEYKLSDQQIAKFLEIGLRPVEASEKEITGDIIAAYLLIPTFKGEWIRQHAKEIKSTWEGSYIPLIIYKGMTACMLVDYKEVTLWDGLRLKINEILQMPIEAIGD